MFWVLPAIGALIWHIFPTQLNDSESIRGSLSKKPMIFAFVGKGRMIGVSFCEVNRRRRSRRGIRKNFPQSSDGRAGLFEIFDVGLEGLLVEQGEEFAAVFLYAGVFTAQHIE